MTNDVILLYYNMQTHCVLAGVHPAQLSNAKLLYSSFHEAWRRVDTFVVCIINIFGYYFDFFSLCCND